MRIGRHANEIGLRVGGYIPGGWVVGGVVSVGGDIGGPSEVLVWVVLESPGVD